MKYAAMLDIDLAQLINQELLRARTKFPKNENLTVALMEEVGELAQAQLQSCGSYRGGNTMKYADALPIAEGLCTLLSLGCERVEIAGSLRREKEEVKDIEIVALPRYDTGGVTYSALDNVLMEAVFLGDLRFDQKVKRDGKRYKRLVAKGKGEIGVDLFLTFPDNWGNILLIRTGNALFSQLCVSPRLQGGLMPDGMCHRDGYLWREDEQLPCPEETDFFAHLGIPFVPPRERGIRAIWELQGTMAQGRLRP